MLAGHDFRLQAQVRRYALGRLPGLPLCQNLILVLAAVRQGDGDPQSAQSQTAVSDLHPHEAAGERVDPGEDSEPGTTEGGQSRRAPPRGPGGEQDDSYIGKAGSNPHGEYEVSEEDAQRTPHTQGT